MSGDGRRLLSDKVRLRNSNNSRTWYYDLSIVVCLGECYINSQVGAIRVNQREARQCYVDCLRIKEGENLPSRAGQMHNSEVSDVNLAELDPREDFREKRP